jgi:hypothetical protein
MTGRLVTITLEKNLLSAEFPVRMRAIALSSLAICLSPVRREAIDPNHHRDDMGLELARTAGVQF